MGFYTDRGTLWQNTNQAMKIKWSCSPFRSRTNLCREPWSTPSTELVDENIDLSVFDERYKNDLTGAAAIHPKILLKVILLAYAKGMISSRQIERACHENIIFIALSYGYAPDHSTIAAFISSMQNEISSIFSDILAGV